MSLIIDAKGKACPQPVLLARQAIQAGEVTFTVEVDNAAAVENLTRLAASQGFSVETVQTGGTYSLAFRKTGEALVSGEAPGGDYVLFVGRDVIGAGERELGENLMRMFFYTLLESGDLPKAVCLMNAGVKLATCDEQVIGHLRGLADRGVEVLVCGACLNYYALSDRLGAGQVSNMYDILTRMQRAEKVISL